ncbi:PH domain-containing protein [Candidatus Saccharibacteria bacterium]|nr:PH domain-containing protein [Candidatus Saccharibacteria bacterium]
MKPSLARIRHARSKQDFPFLKLEENEYVELLITRSKKGLVLIWAGVLLGMATLGVALALVINAITRGVAISAQSMTYFWLFLGGLYVIIILGALISSKVYLANKFFVTNKRVIYYAQNSLFDKSANIIELSRIEDVSYKQSGLLDHLLSFGTLRLSTVGDETTYTFPFVDTPDDELEFIAHLLHKTKQK